MHETKDGHKTLVEFKTLLTNVNTITSDKKHNLLNHADIQCHAADETD